VRWARYLAEFYLPGDRVDLAERVRQARAAAERSCCAGSPAVRLLCVIHVPQDESCFAGYDAASAEAVAAAGALAGIVFDRIVTAITG
jgi:hypothetical protein